MKTRARAISISVMLIAIFIISCSLVTQGDEKIYCGYPIDLKEYDMIRKKVRLQGDPYAADKDWNIYDQINDSIRKVMPDTLEFEIFMSLLNKKEVGIDVFVPKNEKYFELIACKMMNARFTSKMPEQRYLCIYSYTEPDGSGDSPLEVAVKRIK